MAATFNAEPLPEGFSRAQATTRPAAASAGGASAAGGVDAAGGLAAHVGDTNPHTQYSLLNSAPTFTGPVTAPGFVGPLTGNAATATKLLVPRNINGVPFDGSADITISGGGGGSGPLTPDSAPAVAAPANDEFEFGSALDTTGGRRAGSLPWAWDNQGTSTASLAEGSLLLLPQLVAGTTHRGIQQVAPAPPWRYRSKLRILRAAASQAAMYLRRGTRTIKLGVVGESAPNRYGPFVQKLSDNTTVFSDVYYVPQAAGDAAELTRAASPWGYFEIEHDGTTLFFRWSPTGYTGTFYLIHSETPATFLLGDPTHIGLSAQSNSASQQSIALVDWFRSTQLSYVQQVTSDAPVLYTRMNEVSGTTSTNLGSGGGTLTYSGTYTLNQAGFTTGGASVLLPSGGQNGLVWSVTSNYTTAVSLECMFNPAAGGTKPNTFLITKNQFFAGSTSDFPVALRYNQSTRVLTFELDAGGDFVGDRSVSTAPLTSGTDYHVAATWASGQPLRLYLNGVEVAASTAYTATLTAPATNWRIGHAQEFSGGAGNSGFGGRLAEVAIYNSQLSADRIAAHYAARAL